MQRLHQRNLLRATSIMLRAASCLLPATSCVFSATSCVLRATCCFKQQVARNKQESCAQLVARNLLRWCKRCIRVPCCTSNTLRYFRFVDHFSSLPLCSTKSLPRHVITTPSNDIISLLLIMQTYRREQSPYLRVR